MKEPSPWPDVRTILGETPLWSVSEQALYWIDCSRPAVFRRDVATGKTLQWDAPSRVGGILLREGGGIVAVLRSGIFTLDSALANPSQIAPPPFESDHLFLHEARCDPAGRLWVGILNHDFVNHPGGLKLYRLDGDRLTQQPIVDGGDVANGMAWNRDGTIMYFADSVARTVWRFAYDRATGTLSDKRVFAQFGEEDGYPDGAAVDADDGYWVAMCGAGRVIRLRPDGSRDRAIEIPSALPTAVAFGGAALDRMFVTSIGDHAALPGFPQGPHDGAIFELDPGVKGLPEPAFRQ